MLRVRYFLIKIIILVTSRCHVKKPRCLSLLKDEAYGEFRPAGGRGALSLSFSLPCQPCLFERNFTPGTVQVSFVRVPHARRDRRCCRRRSLRACQGENEHQRDNTKRGCCTDGKKSPKVNQSPLPLSRRRAARQRAARERCEPTVASLALMIRGIFPWPCVVNVDRQKVCIICINREARMRAERSASRRVQILFQRNSRRRDVFRRTFR